jgi:hypothetical protein
MKDTSRLPNLRDEFDRIVLSRTVTLLAASALVIRTMSGDTKESIEANQRC